MPLTINGKTFMNLQEAVAWLLANNALPFQSTASFAPDTEIAKSTIINPSPAEIKIGSLVFFADGKVGTVNAVTTNGFKVGSEATDLADGVPHVTNISIDASNHLIITMSEGDPIDAGLIKEVSSMSIDASQHLIVTYNDGTTNDLGAIFQGNVNISGNFTADSIIENMSGYTFTKTDDPNITNEILYAGAVKNGNKVTFCIYSKLTRTGSVDNNYIGIGRFYMPSAIYNKLYPAINNWLEFKRLYAGTNYNSGEEVNSLVIKGNSGDILVVVYDVNNKFTLNTDYYLRFETTFLLSDSLAS